MHPWRSWALGLALLWACDGAAQEPPAPGPVASPQRDADADAGLVRIRSSGSVQETTDRLRAAIEARGLRLFAVIDHAANARGAGLELPDTQLIVFGNPNVGTLLMQGAPTLAIDLPQKYLVWSEAGQTWIAYNAPAYLARRHALEGRADVLQRIETLLSGLAQQAAGP